MQAVAGHTLGLGMLQQSLDALQVFGVDVDRHLQPVVELAEIGIVGDVALVAAGIEAAERNAEPVARDGDAELQEDEELLPQPLTGWRGGLGLAIDTMQREGKVRTIGRYRMAVPVLLGGDGDDAADELLKFPAW